MVHVQEGVTAEDVGVEALGAPTHGGLPALMDASASQERWRHARSNVLIINPDAPPVHITANTFVAPAAAHGADAG